MWRTEVRSNEQEGTQSPTGQRSRRSQDTLLYVNVVCSDCD